MSKQVKISPEIARLAQQRVAANGRPLADELARMVVEEAVLSLDPEEGFLLQADEAFSQNDSLVQTVGVNDVVVNGKHIDVRCLDGDGQISIDSVLIGSTYLANGTLVVQLDGTCAGRIICYVAADGWQNAFGNAGSLHQVCISVEPSEPVNLSAIVNNSAERKTSEGAAVDSNELVALAASRETLSFTRQKELIEILLNDSSAQAAFAQVASFWSNRTLSRILSSSSAWYSRVERLADKLAPKFAGLKRDQVRALIVKAGEIHGGQPEAPAFRKSLLTSLAREEMVNRIKGVDLAKATALIDKVMSGKASVDAVNDLLKNKVAVDLAMTIKRQRQKVEGFVAATADEIGFAFQQLALQPAYATHSKDPKAGVESINEALEMLEAGELAERLKQLEDDISV